MIKIVLNNGSARGEKDNKSYGCFREFNGEKTIYGLYVLPLPRRLRIENMIKSESLADINEWLAKTEVEIVED